MAAAVTRHRHQAWCSHATLPSSPLPGHHGEKNVTVRYEFMIVEKAVELFYRRSNAAEVVSQAQECSSGMVAPI